MFDPQEFYKLAVSLSKTKQYTEALGRTIISRAYYAAFLQVREKVGERWPNILKELRREVKCRGGEHWIVREALKRGGHPNISGKLKALFQTRVDADYKLNIIIKRDNIDEALQLAKNIMGLMKNV